MFDFSKRVNINEGLAEYEATKGALLIDVRTSEEYESGHIKGGKNIETKLLPAFIATGVETETPIFVYCASGARSNLAVKFLKRQGYTKAKNIGGIVDYSSSER
ncbi:phage shock protein E [Lachnospiraceae bacterium PFB1-21]